MSEEMESEALREVKCRREEREAAGEESPSDWDLVEEAVEKKQWNVVRWVLRQGAIVDVNKERGAAERTLLQDACHDGDLEMVKMLLQELGACVWLFDRRGWSAVFYACDGGHVDVLRFLLTEGGAEEGFDIRDEVGDYPLHVGVHSLPVVRCLVEEFGADIEANGRDGELPIQRVLRAGDVPCLRYFLGKHECLDAESLIFCECVLHFAAEAESAEALRYLVEECGCDPSLLEEDQGDLLPRAARSKSSEALQYLVEECGVPLDVEGDSGGNMLREAAQSGATEVAEHLLQHYGICPSAACGPEEWRLLHTAAERGHLSMVKWLVERGGVDVEAADADGWRAIHFAEERSVLQWLVEEAGADVNAQTNAKETTLHLAARVFDIECAKYVVEEADADVLLEDKDGKRPSQLAMRHDELAAYLEEAEEMALMQKNPE